MPAHNKLRPEQVYSIRAKYREGLHTQGELARHYGVTVTTIGRIVRNEMHIDRKLEVRPIDRVIEEVKANLLAEQERDARRQKEIDSLAPEERKHLTRYD